MTQHINLDRIHYFTAVVEAGSFTAAAQRLRVNKAVVSHQIAKLEEELQVALLIRTTRSVSPSEEGQAFYLHCVEILRISQEAVSELDLTGGQPSGRLIVAAPVELAETLVMPAVQQFLQAYPDMKVDLMIEDRLANLVEEKIDISVRLGWPTDSTNRSRKIGSFEQWLVARPDIATMSVAVSTPDELQTLPWIVNNSLRSSVILKFAANDESHTVSVEGIVETTTTTAARLSALAGIGFTVLPDFLITSDIAAGRLVRVRPDWELPVGGIYLFFPPSRYKPTKVLLFEKILEANFAKGLTSL